MAEEIIADKVFADGGRAYVVLRPVNKYSLVLMEDGWDCAIELTSEAYANQIIEDDGYTDYRKK